MRSFVSLEKNSIAVGELPNINGEFGCAVPDNHTKYTSGVFVGTDFGSFTGSVMHGGTDGTVYGFYMNFGNNKRHNNVSPCLGAYIWQRTV